jgi:hypothetical protein
MGFDCLGCVGLDGRAAMERILPHNLIFDFFQNIYSKIIEIF